MNEEAIKSALFSYRGRGEPREVIGAGIRYEIGQARRYSLPIHHGRRLRKTLNCRKAVPYLEKILKVDDTYPKAQTLMDQCRKNEKESVPLS